MTYMYAILTYGGLMQDKIQREMQNGVYIRKNAENALCPAYINTQRGWINYAIGGKVTFSHRKNDYERYQYPYSLEMHDYYELIIYLSEETLQYIADEQYFTFPQGSALLIKPHTMHMLKLSEFGNCERYVINFRSPETLFPDNSVLGFLNRGNENYALFPASENSFAEICEQIEYILSSTETPFQHTYAVMKLTELFIKISENRTADGEEINIADIHLSVPDFIIDVKSYIDNNYLDIASVSALAERFHYNREYLTRSFKRYFNTSVWNYVILRRLMYCGLLLRNGESVSRAALKSGFANRANFTKLFRRHFGCTPSEYSLRY